MVVVGPETGEFRRPSRISTQLAYRKSRESALDRQFGTMYDYSWPK